MIKNPGARGWRWLAWLWLVIVLVAGMHQFAFWQDPAVESDVFALLPEDARDPQLTDATRRIAESSTRQIVVLLGADTVEQLDLALRAYRDALAARERQQALPFSESDSMQGWFEASREFYLPWRDRLLSGEQRRHLLETSIDELADDALAALYSPVGAPRLAQWQADPLNLWAGWWQSRAAGTGLRVDSGGLLHAEGRVWRVLQFQITGGAFRMDGRPRLADALDEAAAAARGAIPGVKELRAGVPLHAEAAAIQANGEINVIGWGSMIAVLLLTWLAFHSLRPVVLVLLSLLVGVAVGLSVTIAAFGGIHLLTLVFGASLVGVAVDYGIHWFAARQGNARIGTLPLLHRLLPGMLLAWLTSALAYLALGLTPIPGLRQMAVFSVAGLAAAFVTVLCWFPWLDRAPPPETALSRRMGRGLANWPRARVNRRWLVVAVLAVLLVASGLGRLHIHDDLRYLQSSPAALVEQQVAIGRLLALPSPAQFYLVQGANEEELLSREQSLTERLQALVADGHIQGYRAISDWLPPAHRQEADAALTQRVEAAVLERLSMATGETLVRAEFRPQALGLQDWLASPASLPLRQLWLGEMDGPASAVMVQAVGGDALLQRLAAQADGLEGVRWVNRTGDFSALLGEYRDKMSWLLLTGMGLVAVALVARYRREAWRAGLPTLLAGVLTVSALAWLGQPLQLFNVLALLLLLGVGIDYGIFLLEHRADPSAWLAVCGGAASTWLSFGLLALSATPALRTFGLTLLLGVGLVWLLTPLFRPGNGMPDGTHPPVGMPPGDGPQ